MRRLSYALLLVALVAGPARAHGNLRMSDPEADSRLDAAPDVVTMELAEPPTPDSRFAVLDGCGDDVVDDVTLDDRNVRVAVSSGEPGRWRVEYRVVSALDGHLVRGDFVFRVAGPRDCTAGDGDETPPPAGDSADEDEIVGPGLEDDETGGIGPFVPMLAVGGGIVLVAFVIRKLMSR